MDNVLRFIDAFSRIENTLKKEVNSNKYLSFRILVDICSKNNVVVKMNYSKLLDYADLRNILVHHRDDDNKIVAVPTDACVNDIENIADLIDKDKGALEFSSSPVITINLDQSILSVFKIMDKLNTSKLPIYDGDKFIKLVTIEMITRWSFNTNLKDGSVKDLLEYKDTRDNVVFFDKNNRLSDVLNSFEYYYKNGSRLQAIIISENGRKNEKPLGIITAYDLPRIIEFLT